MNYINIFVKLQESMRNIMFIQFVMGNVGA